jgi:hypothetical protein
MENDSIKLFESKQIRTAWDEEQEKWYFSEGTPRPDQRRNSRNAQIV